MSDIFNDLNNVLKPLINFKISERLVGKFIGGLERVLLYQIKTSYQKVTE